MPNNKIKGFLLGAIAAATYGMNPLFALPLYADGMNPESVLFWRYLLAVVMVAVMLRVRGWSFAVEKRVAIALGALGVAMALSSLGLFMSYNYMPAGIASTLLFVYPIMVAVIMAVCFGERVRALTVVCLLMATCGIALLYKGENGATLSLLGTLLVLGSALLYAGYLVAVSRRGLKEVPTLVVTFYVLLFGLGVFVAEFIAGVPMAIPSGSEWWLWGNLVCLALFPTVISFVCTTRAIHYVGSTPTAILGSLEPVTAVVIGVLVFGETLTARDLLGLVVIVTAVTLVVAGGGLTRPLLRFRKLFAVIRRHK